MSTTEHQFRNAVVGGFNRQDVLDFLEASSQAHVQQVQELQHTLEEVRCQCTKQQEDAQQCREELEGLTRQLQEAQQQLEESQKALSECQTLRSQDQAELEEARRELEQLRGELEAQRQLNARLADDAAAYAAVKERSAGVELDAHRRAQLVLDQGNHQALELRRQMEQWLGRVSREYDSLRSQVDATVSHAADELSGVQKALDQIVQLLSDQDIALEALAEAYAKEEPQRVAAPMPIAET